MKTRIGCNFEFEACHHLPNEEIYGECSKWHGHRYELEVEFEGEICPETGWICNFKDIKKIIKDNIIKKYDHSNLNDFFEIPTVEIVGLEIFNTIELYTKTFDYHLYKVKLFETSDNYVELTK